MLAPIRPRPIIPSCINCSIQIARLRDENITEPSDGPIEARPPGPTAASEANLSVPHGKVVPMTMAEQGRGQALVVGASSSIGSAIAVELAGLGFSLTLWGRDPERLQRAAEACSGAGGAVGRDQI